MPKIKALKSELADKICRQRRLKVGTAEYKTTHKSLMKLSYPALVNLFDSLGG